MIDKDQSLEFRLPDGAREQWVPTPKLRYKVKLLRGVKGGYLQQMWQSNTGKSEWREIPEDDTDE